MIAMKAINVDTALSSFGIGPIFCIAAYGSSFSRPRRDESRKRHATGETEQHQKSCGAVRESAQRLS